MQEGDEQLESLLMRYRPVGPRHGMRERVLPGLVPVMSLGLRVWRFAAAAMIGLTVLLIFDGQRIARGSAQLATAPPAWTPQAETAVAILGGGDGARRYVAVTLALDERRLRNSAARQY